MPRLMPRLMSPLASDLRRLCITAAFLGVGASAADPYGLDARPAATPYLGVPPQPPTPAGGFRAEVAYPHLAFRCTTSVRPVPGTNRMWAMEREGKIWEFVDDPAATTKTLVLDLNAPEHITNGARWWCQGWHDCGLFGLAFHPQFNVAGSPNRNSFFIYYMARDREPSSGAVEIPGCSDRLARFTLSDGAPQVTAASEVVLIDQPDHHLWHNGGDVCFGNDGFLYTVNGDEGRSYDWFNNSQTIRRRFFSGIVRIDVDGPRPGISHAIPRQASKFDPNDPTEPQPFSGNYGIPDDNPFVGVPGVLEEFYALGLRNPHRMTFDPPTGRLIAADVGEGSREEIDVIVPGGNYQWAYKQGHHQNRTERIPPSYQTTVAIAAGATTIPVDNITLAEKHKHVAPGMLAIGDRVRLANHATVYQVTSLAGYPHSAIGLSPALTADVPMDTKLIRTTGFTVVATTGTTPFTDLPNGVGSTTLSIAGSGTLVPGSSVSFPGIGISYQIIAASGTPHTTSITVRPALPTAPLPGSTVDRMTVMGTEQPPAVDFPRTGIFALSGIIGGYVYRGSRYPELFGKYIFADNPRGTVFAADGLGTLSPTVQPLFAMPEYANRYRGVSSFGLDHEGEMLICRMQAAEVPLISTTGKIWRIARNTASGTPIPTDLKDTGAFVPDADGTLTSLTPSPSLIPYEVNSPLWSDGAHKRRWIAVPTGQQIGYNPTGGWTFPAGTVFVKHFELTTNEQTGQRRRLETRLLVRSPGSSGVYGVTYKWNASGTSATLVGEGGLNESYTITGPNGATRAQTWSYPSRNDCLTCHTDTAGHVLGVNTRQLNGPCSYPATGVTDNQLRAWSHVGLFDAPPAESAIPGLARLVPVGDSSATLAHRVRSWLDANCSHCHRPDGVPANFDARYDTPLAEQGIVDGLVNGTLEIPDARVIAPGNVARSIMHLRDGSLDPAIKMPPLAKNVVDAEAMATLTAWIGSLAVEVQVAITAPAAGAHVPRGAPTILSATLGGADSGDVTSVDFLANGVVVGTDATAPYAVAWTPTATGTLLLTAVAHTDGGDATSSLVTITVVEPTPSTIALASPAAGAHATTPGGFALLATTGAGTVASVQFLRDGAVVASDTTAPYEADVENLTAGTYVFTARATDPQGLVTTSAPVTVTVGAPGAGPGGTGTILREWWNGIGDNTVAALTSSPAFPLSPSGRSWPESFEAPSDVGANFGTRMSGYVVPPVTGPYVFWIAGDDQCELWLSSDDLPANRTRIATVPAWAGRRQWNKVPAQQSAPVVLTAGVTYYVEALHKESGSKDHVAVGWRLPNGVLERPIPGNRLMPYIVVVSQKREPGWSVRLP